MAYSPNTRFDARVVSSTDLSVKAYIPRCNSLDFSEQLNDVGGGKIVMDYNDSFFTEFNTEYGDGALFNGTYAIQIIREGVIVSTFMIEDVSVERVGYKQEIVMAGRGLAAQLEWAVVLPEGYHPGMNVRPVDGEPETLFDREILAYEFVAHAATTTSLAASFGTGTVLATQCLTASSNGSINSVAIDGVTDLIVGSVVLVKNQANSAHNGIYYVYDTGSAGSPWILARDANFYFEEVFCYVGSRTYVMNGTSNKAKVFEITSCPSTYDSFGTSAITFSESSTSYTALSLFYALFREADEGVEIVTKKGAATWGNTRSGYGRGGSTRSVNWALTLDPTFMAAKGLTDSKGALPKDGGNVTINKGKTMLEALNTAAEQTECDWKVSPTGVVKIAKKTNANNSVPFGTDRTSGNGAILLPLPLANSSNTKTSTRDTRSTVFGTNSYLIDVIESSSVLSVTGRRESYIENSSDDTKGVTNIASTGLNKISGAKFSVDVEFVETENRHAFLDFTVGDKILIEYTIGQKSERIVSGISVSIDSNLSVKVQLTLNEVIPDSVVSLQNQTLYGTSQAQRIKAFLNDSRNPIRASSTPSTPVSRVSGLSNGVSVAWNNSVVGSASSYDAEVYRTSQMHRIIGKTRVSNVATLTTADVHAIQVGDKITVAGLGGYNTSEETVTAVNIDNQTVSYSNTGSNDAGGLVTSDSWLEASIPITLISKENGVCTATTSRAHGLAVGQQIIVSDADVDDYSVFNKTVISVPTSTTFTYQARGSDSAEEYNIGDTGPAGGFIFLTPDSPGNTTGKYFESAPWSVAYKPTGEFFNVIWSQDTEYIDGASGTALGTGEQNTQDIIDLADVYDGTTAVGAAALAREYTYGGYSDWFLPSQDELHALITPGRVDSILVAVGENTSSSAVFLTSTQSNLAIGEDYPLGTFCISIIADSTTTPSSSVADYMVKNSYQQLRLIPVRSFSTSVLGVSRATTGRLTVLQELHTQRTPSSQTSTVIENLATSGRPYYSRVVPINRAGDPGYPSNPAPFFSSSDAMSVVGGAIKSPNYQTGTSGWLINSDGTAEFGNVTVRGTVTSSVITGSSMSVGSSATNSFYVDTSGNHWAGSADRLTAPFRVDADGSLYISGSSFSGGVSAGDVYKHIGGANVTTISGGVITSGTINLANGVNIQSSGNTARVNITSSGFYAYNTSGTEMVGIDASTGAARFKGNISASAITGTTFSNTDSDTGTTTFEISQKGGLKIDNILAGPSALGGSPGLQILANGTAKNGLTSSIGSIYIYSGASNEIRLGNSDTAHLKIKSTALGNVSILPYGGRVLIGPSDATTFSGRTLTVSGDIQMLGAGRQDLFSQGGFSALTKGYSIQSAYLAKGGSSGWYLCSGTSSSIYKENISTLDTATALNDILSLTPKSFTWKHEEFADDPAPAGIIEYKALDEHRGFLLEDFDSSNFQFVTTEPTPAFFELTEAEVAALDASSLQDPTLFSSVYWKESAVLATAVAAIKELKLLSDGHTSPVGVIMPYAGDYSVALPENWLFCDGQMVQKNLYPALYDALTANGTVFPYGPDDDSVPEDILFRLPNMSTRVPAGYDYDGIDPVFQTIGDAFGDKEHTLTVDEIPSHTHTVRVDSAAGGTASGIPPSNGTDSGFTVTTSATGGGQPHLNMQPSIILHYIIKVK